MMSQFIDLDETDKEIIGDILANIEDWAERNQDLKSQFIAAVHQNNHKLNSDFINYLFDSYFSIDTLTRNSPRFNHVLFVEDKVESFKADRLH